jgi:serine protease Do
VIAQLERNGRVRHSFLGIFPGQLTPQVADQFGIEAESGVLVLSVTEDSPADGAGLEEGDLIVATDGEPVRIVEDLLSRLREHEPGDRIALELVRADERREIDVTLADRTEGC